METTWHDNERDAAIGRQFNLWSEGCREQLNFRHHTPPVVLSLPDLLSRFARRTAETWKGLSWSQTELLRVARRTLFELRAAEVTRRAAT